MFSFQGFARDLDRLRLPRDVHAEFEQFAVIVGKQVVKSCLAPAPIPNQLTVLVPVTRDFKVPLPLKPLQMVRLSASLCLAGIENREAQILNR